MEHIKFEHKMAAHCETGTIAALLTHKGTPISEPMVLGITGGIFFAYLQSNKFPFPMFVVRTKPGHIRKTIGKRVGAKFKAMKFKDQKKAEESLDSLLSEGIPAAVQVDMFYMDYIPKHMKAHFNGHFITAIGKEDNKYVVSDCYYPNLAELTSSSMLKGRFAGGDLAPKGLIYYPESVTELSEEELKKSIIKGLKDACKGMLKIPVPFVGIKGIRKFANKIMTWPSIAKDEEHLSHEIMNINVILEERGTGGGGFRFMYASFLQEAANIFNSDELMDMSKRMMSIGDHWREVSLKAARTGKNRDFSEKALSELSKMIHERADEEEIFFKDLLSLVKKGI